MPIAMQHVHVNRPLPVDPRVVSAIVRALVTCAWHADFLFIVAVKLNRVLQLYMTSIYIHLNGEHIHGIYVVTNHAAQIVLTGINLSHQIANVIQGILIL